MQLTLTRQPADGKSVRGLLSLSSGETFPTLENTAYIIPAGTYPVSVTMSPKFKRPLPLLSGVVGAPGQPTKQRLGIRIHRGTRPEHSTGCILVAPKDEPALVNLLRGQSHTLTIK